MVISKKDRGTSLSLENLTSHPKIKKCFIYLVRMECVVIIFMIKCDIQRSYILIEKHNRLIKNTLQYFILAPILDK